MLFEKCLIIWTSKQCWPESDREWIGLAAPGVYSVQTFSFLSCSCSLTHCGIQIFGRFLFSRSFFIPPSPALAPAILWPTVEFRFFGDFWKLFDSYLSCSSSCNSCICICILYQYFVFVFVSVFVFVFLLLMNAVRDGRWAEMARSILLLRHFANRGRAPPHLFPKTNPRKLRYFQTN